jgi:NMT1-like family
MPKATFEQLGLLPSLEVLPLFCGGGEESSGLPFGLSAFSSYGEISRDLLTRKLIGGVIPWEIFVSDVLALPGQRASWKVLMFLHPCPTELVLREPVYRAFYPTHPAQGRGKRPTRLTVAVESRNSLTKAQSRHWLDHWKDCRGTELVFQMLPMDLMIQALEAEAIDAIIAPSPWGFHAEAAGIGKRDPRFTPGKFAQQLVMVCHRDFLDQHPGLDRTLPSWIASARAQLQSPPAMESAISRMHRTGRPAVRGGLLEQAAEIHSFNTLDRDIVPDVAKLVSELMALEDFSVLPAQVAASEQTARLLLPAG